MDFNKHVNMGPVGIRPANHIISHGKAVFCMLGTYVGTYLKSIRRATRGRLKSEREAQTLPVGTCIRDVGFC
jgi:hypothetical protein